MIGVLVGGTVALGLGVLAWRLRAATSEEL